MEATALGLVVCHRSTRGLDKPQIVRWKGGKCCTTSSQLRNANKVSRFLSTLFPSQFNQSYALQLVRYISDFVSIL